MRVLVSGYYGFGNLGDEALLAIIVATLRRRHPAMALDVLSAQPEETARAYGVEATPRADLRLVRAAIARADVVVSGGGGLLQNATSTRSLLYYAGILRGAIRSGKKTMIFAQSIGPLDFVGRAIVRVAARGITAATVRDERSRELLEPLLPGVAIERTADPVFLYDPPVGNGRIERLGEGGPLVVVSVRSSANFGRVARSLAAVVDLFADRYDARVAFLPLGGASDAEAATHVIRAAKSSPLLLPENGLDGAARIIAGAHAVIGMRLHALILAARLGVPFLAIPYDPKVSALCDDLRYPLPALIDPVSTPPSRDRLAAMVERLWSSRDALAHDVRAAAEVMRGRAERNFDVLDELLR